MKIEFPRRVGGRVRQIWVPGLPEEVWGYSLERSLPTPRAKPSLIHRTNPSYSGMAHSSVTGCPDTTAWSWGCWLKEYTWPRKETSTAISYSRGQCLEGVSSSYGSRAQAGLRDKAPPEHLTLCLEVSSGFFTVPSLFSCWLPAAASSVPS